MTDITLLDGSIGQELVKRSDDRATPLWSTQVMIDHPDLVGEVHGDYFAAGSTVATTNTYAVHRNRLARVGLEDQVPRLVATAIGQAKSARDAAGGGRVAGALGPLFASYRPDLMPDESEAERQFGALVDLMEEHVDLFLIETVSSLQEARGVLRAAVKSAKPVWIAFSTDDHDGTILRSGEPLGAVAEVLQEFRPDAVLINCTRPEVISAGLKVLKPMGLPLGAYGNGFTKISDAFKADAPTVDALEQRQDMTPDQYAQLVMGWVQQGATIVGGCCEIGPEHIREIAAQLNAAGHRIV